MDSSSMIALLSVLLLLASVGCCSSKGERLLTDSQVHITAAFIHSIIYVMHIPPTCANLYIYSVQCQ